ncbi:DUF1343 domain-containing protein [bacterium (Candidatus Blackallbacteria) CG17_big_fil_post_rev_8_21_14_2_50_48_46]|uniref:DUF1343 domain-containing protein n=1 Tax=bacterium (Candidatus Blackallbacteria) CG17_big_fil_post_rev_8_21_14_2_50_48_46 TaxID=2014261 RepID=A0A2M7FYQ5_9BACT|nr:MAG: hypothetical protein COW64_14210 [bacterium (Candidatus Blackallbacteria) CG18_big_fil_WC_8_21_14_2_50_49_26]PIW14501.1 MAG: DUF1343 domain-containing protein [bacterium (Candidatus Blackallbacteria) CG17_big_fil_post_rev_8_21_14_2_50_48_46]PIW47186.1 MAG: DUF1343 domain-containing protein [bacterium (Candidatus Blackallbacteria) CG13_big_fil_rev_8_21_14_2_50_49_14]
MSFRFWGWALYLLLGFLFLPLAQALPLPGAEQPARYLPLLKGHSVGLVVNPTSRAQGLHLVDFLQAQGISVKRIFAPEHGFRGEAEAGAHLADGVDSQTGLPVVSLYGQNRKPKPETLRDLDLLVFDIQDVGVRYYTYISTLHYVMEAAAEAGKPLLVLDRPNPNADQIDGPVLEPAFRSFVGLHPIPLVHGLTVGELARMIQGESWIEHAQALKLSVIPVQAYTHATPYSLPVKPSPNLPNDLAIRLYPSLGLFEGTRVSVGRGTDWPFQVLGLPDVQAGAFVFRPQSRQEALTPPYQDQACYGLDLRQETDLRFSLRWLLYFYQHDRGEKAFFNPFFDKLAGTDHLRKQIEAGLTEAEIRQGWEKPLADYRQLRARYLLYPEH